MDKILHADVETDDVISLVFLITKNSIDIFKLTNSEDIFACSCMTCNPSYVYKIITQVKIFNFRIPYVFNHILSVQTNALCRFMQL